MNNLKQHKTAVLIVLVTIVLAGVAIFTAVRLAQLGQQPVAPNVPQSTPGAAGNPNIVSCDLVAFTIGDTPTPTPTASPSPTPSGTPVTSTTPRPTASVTPRPSSSPVVVVTPQPTEPSLPQAGVATPTVVGVGAALILLVSAIALAK